MAVMAATYDQAVRSLTVSNMPFEIPDNALRQIFSQVGAVHILQIVPTRDPNGRIQYYIVEFSDMQQVENAVKVNGLHVGGRPLKVDRMIIPPVPAPAVVQDSTADDISKSVESLPPEKMFDLMKQMKEVVMTNSTEAKHLLNENVQLAYALLQAQVVMRIVDPKVALAMIYREPPMAGASTAGAPPPGPMPIPPPSTSRIDPRAAASSSGAAMETKPVIAKPGMPTFAKPMMPPMRPPQMNPSMRPPPVPNPIDMLPEEARTLILQVLQLPDSEIAQLPPSEKERIMALKMKYAPYAT